MSRRGWSAPWKLMNVQKQRGLKVYYFYQKEQIVDENRKYILLLFLILLFSMFLYMSITVYSFDKLLFGKMRFSVF